MSVISNDETSVPFEELLDEMCLSELVVLAQHHEPEAHRDLGREELINLILEATPVDPLPQRKINRVRLRIMDYVIRNWELVRPLAQACPAGTKNPRACFRCTDLQAAECASLNQEELEQDQ